MRKAPILITLLLATISIKAQERNDSITFDPRGQLNAAQRLLSGNYGSAVTVGAYGEMIYNQPEGANGELDVRRLVLLFGYRFDDRTQFVTELEVEHVEEIYVEQAFVNYNLPGNVNLRGGLMLVPMGIINEFHEPTTFNGVNRPQVDRVIVPTTWRELDLGVSGRFDGASLGYQVYVFNGFKSTDSDGEGGVTGYLGGASGLRGGRQKGIQSTIESPDLSLKLDYYGLPRLRLGLAGYFGRTEATDDVKHLRGSKVGMAMVGMDARFALNRFTARGEFIHSSFSGTEAYNTLTGRNLGSSMSGWYLEAAYNLLPMGRRQRLFSFLRYERYDTQAGTAGGLPPDPAYNRQDLTAGLSYHIAPGVVVKGDYQFRGNAEAHSEVPNSLNFGLGVWF